MIAGAIDTWDPGHMYRGSEVGLKWVRTARGPCKWHRGKRRVRHHRKYSDDVGIVLSSVPVCVTACFRLNSDLLPTAK